MKKALIFLCLFLLANSLFPQETTLGNTMRDTSNSAIRSKKVLLIPFDNKMYRSDADRDISAESRIGFEQIRSAFRQNLNKSLYQQALYNFSVQSLLDHDPEIKKDLEYVYASIAYKYELLPPAQQEGKKEAKSFKELLASRKAETPAAGIQNGQIHTVPDNHERYMKTQISNPAVLSYLNEKYGSEILVFINELDIRIAPNTGQEAIMNNNYNRQAKAHYTVMDKNGAVLSSGAAFAEFSSRTNNINQISRMIMPQLSSEIIRSFNEKAKEY